MKANYDGGFGDEQLLTWSLTASKVKDWRGCNAELEQA